MTKAVIAETAAKAKQLLFDKAGKPKGQLNYCASFTLNVVLRPAHHEKSPIGSYNFRWGGRRYVYDAAIAEALLLAAVGPAPDFADQVLRMVAAGMLEGTGGIPDPRLRNYVAKRLSGDICPAKKGRGGDNSFRDAALVGLLIPFLLAKGFQPTRNDSTEGECACSILSEALDQIGIDLSEKRLSNLWARRVF